MSVSRVVEVTDAEGVGYVNFCMATGHLFLTFANLENVLTGSLKLHLARCVENPEEPDNSHYVALASAVYGSMRFSASRDVFKRIAQVEKADKQRIEAMLAVFMHVGDIMKLRDMLAHQNFMPASGGEGKVWRMSDQFTTKDSNNIKTYFIDQDSVKIAAYDLVKISEWITEGEVTKQLIESVVPKILPTPLLYKSSMLKLAPRKKSVPHK